MSEKKEILHLGIDLGTSRSSISIFRPSGRASLGLGIVQDLVRGTPVGRRDPLRVGAVAWNIVGDFVCGLPCTRTSQNLCARD